MKMYWSILFTLSLFTIIGCSKEQFGTVPQSQTSKPDPIKSYEQLSCSSHTLVKPKVDVLYVVDNSTSTYYVPNDIKKAIHDTVDKISKEFDYRVIGTSLLPIPGDETPFNDYQVLTNSQDPLSSEASGRKVISSNELTFFQTPVNGSERGLKRIIEFINYNASSGLFRKNAYLLMVMISNGRDVDVEYDSGFNNGETTQNTAIFNARRDNFIYLKNQFNSQQLRLFSVTAKRNCQSGWLSSQKSYIQMSKELYNLSGATDSNMSVDSYDLCGTGISSIFTAVNNAIKQVVVPHVYRYWPITFAENNETVSLSEVKVYKVSGNNAPVEIPGSEWSYYENASGAPLNTRELPTAGEPVAGKHFVRFNNGSLITYPDCVQVKSVSRTEYFGYVVLPKNPIPDSIVLRINGRDIPKSTTNGWSFLGFEGYQKNIKMPYPNSGDEFPAVYKSGFMIQLNGSSNYYKSGDNIEVYYLPAPL